MKVSLQAEVIPGELILPMLWGIDSVASQNLAIQSSGVAIRHELRTFRAGNHGICRFTICARFNVARVDSSPSTGCLQFSLVASQCDCGCIALSETDWRIGSETVVRPVISVICGDLPEEHIDDAPSVIAEVLSPATAGKDLTAKRALYAEQGVFVYLILDPDECVLTALQLNDGQDTEIPSASNGDVAIKWAKQCRAQIALPDVFQGVKK